MGRRTRVMLRFASGVVLLVMPPLASSLPQSKHKGAEADINAIGKRNIAKGTNFYSSEKERELGKQLSHEVERSSKPLDDPVVNGYVDKLAQIIARNSDAHVPIFIKVIESDLPNLIVLPGGYLYVNTGLILQATGEAELASALAHGIAHVALRHETKLATKGELIQLATIPLIILGPGGWGGYGHFGGMNLAIPLSYLKELREAEFDADYFGLQYLYKAGYAPESWIRFLERTFADLQAKEKVPEKFSPYPRISDRVKAMNDEINHILPSRSGAVVSTPEFETIHERLRLQRPTKPCEENKPSLRTRTILE